MHCPSHIQKNSDIQCLFPASDSVTRRQCTLARCERPLPLGQHPARALGAFLASVAPWPAYAGVSCGGRSAVAADRKQNGGSTPFGATQATWWLRVATSLPAHACSTVAVARHAQSALPAADRPAQPRSVELPLNNPIPTRLASKRNQGTSTTTLNL